MGMSRLSNIVEEFKKHKPLDFPISIVQNGTTKNNRSISGTLESIEELVATHQISNPAVIFIGNAANDAVTQYDNLQNQEAIWV
jgi:uroporphyrin-III C-methyltransferase